MFSFQAFIFRVRQHKIYIIRMIYQKTFCFSDKKKDSFATVIGDLTMQPSLHTKELQRNMSNDSSVR